MRLDGCRDGVWHFLKFWFPVQHLDDFPWNMLSSFSLCFLLTCIHFYNSVRNFDGIDTELVPSWYHVGTNFVPTWAHAITKSVPTWCHIGTNLVPTWYKLVPFGYQVDTKLVPLRQAFHGNSTKVRQQIEGVLQKCSRSWLMVWRWYTTRMEMHDGNNWRGFH